MASSLRAFVGGDAPAGEHHAHRLIKRDHARRALESVGACREPDVRLGQRERGALGGDDEVAGERDLNAAAKTR